MHAGLAELGAQRRERVLEPVDDAAAAQVWTARLRRDLERDPERGAQRGLVVDQATRDLGEHEVEPRLDIRGRRCAEQRGALEDRERRDQELALVAEVAV